MMTTGNPLSVGSLWLKPRSILAVPSWPSLLETSRCVLALCVCVCVCVCVFYHHTPLTPPFQAEVVRLTALALGYFPEVAQKSRLIADALEFRGVPVDTCSFDSYFTTDELRGGRHRVYVAIAPSSADKVNTDSVVLKEFLAEGDADIACFRNEVKKLIRTRSAHVVNITRVFFGVDEADRRCAYIEMPYYAGGDLGQWLAAGDRSQAEKQRVLRGALEGLAHVHAVGIMHLGMLWFVCLLNCAVFFFFGFLALAPFLFVISTPRLLD